MTQALIEKIAEAVGKTIAETTSYAGYREKLNDDLEVVGMECFADGYIDINAIAQAALTAISDAGYVIVPREPTEAMLDAAAPYDIGQDIVYKAMIAQAEKEGADDSQT